ncbi:MAG: 1-acyl-sn-glycerol-3-phosphate acyltransferase [Bdellovibrionales bacterium]|nr:1-acyl-sn-glycerol-3-phosphate acyltransferase [Bdellovibrionales bacterium]
MREWNYENDQWTKLPYHLRHLPLFSRQFDLISIFLRFLWFLFLRYLFFQFYIRLKVKGDFAKVFKENPKLLVISNHSSHLDAVCISTAMPFRFWPHLFFAAAKDYFFSSFWVTFFSKHCIGAIPIDRKDKKGEAIRLCVTLLSKLPRMWLVMFPEGTRSKDGKIYPFKKGVSVFAQRTDTPLLFLFLEGAYDLWPRGAPFARPGFLKVHVGPVHPPAPIEEIDQAFQDWVNSFLPGQFVPRPQKPAPILPTKEVIEENFQPNLEDHIDLQSLPPEPPNLDSDLSPTDAYEGDANPDADPGESEATPDQSST